MFIPIVINKITSCCKILEKSQKTVNFTKILLFRQDNTKYFTFP